MDTHVSLMRAFEFIAMSLVCSLNPDEGFLFVHFQIPYAIIIVGMGSGIRITYRNLHITM